MPRRTRRYWIIVATIAVVSIALIVAGTRRFLPKRDADTDEKAQLAAKPEAPPDLAKLRDSFTAGFDALGRDDGAEAVRLLSSFDFGNRAVEEYRLYYLANGHQLTGDKRAARVTLARLWQRNPRLVYAADAGLTLGSLYESAADWQNASRIYASIHGRGETPEVAAATRWHQLETSFRAGDVGSALFAARRIIIDSPKSQHAASAANLARALSGTPATAQLALTHAERLERVESLRRDRDPQSALEELAALEPVASAELRPAVQLQRGLALHQLRRFEESTKVLEPLTSGSLKQAVPALLHASRNYAIVAASIDPTVNKVITEKKKVGTIKVRVGKGKKRRLVTKPKFANVKRTIKLVDLAKKNKKDEYERLASERLKDLLQLPVDEETRVTVLTSLIARAESKNQDDYVRELVTQLIKLEPNADPALQHFWDKAWGAYARGDLNGARPLFRFIADTYRNPNVRRQSEYWYARTIERTGQKEEAQAIYRRLASAPYDDVYAIYSESRGARRTRNGSNPLTTQRPDWGEIAEQRMPKELRLAYELTALSHYRDARVEIQRNAQRKNRTYADALLADLYRASGNTQLMYTTLRRAWPDLATVEQDSVPPYFLKMYYPNRYEEVIEENAKKHALDPNLVRALILQESYFNPKARSPVGATGLMQLMPATAKELGLRLYGAFTTSRLENPETNIELGTMHLRRLMNLFSNNQYLVVASYNAGQGNVLKWRRAAPRKPIDEFLESIPFPETRNYVKRVTLLKSTYGRITAE